VCKQIPLLMLWKFIFLATSISMRIDVLSNLP
jgi:hypothetical protein